MDKAVTLDEAIRRHRMISDKEAQLKREREVVDDKLKRAKSELAAIIMAKLNEQGVESARTLAGTAFKAEVCRWEVKDRDEFMAFAVENPSFLPASVNKKSADEYLEENGEAPPGCNPKRFIEIRVHAPKANVK